MVSRSTTTMSKRLDKISRTRVDVDMDLHKDKTKTMHVRHQEEMVPPSVETIKKKQKRRKNTSVNFVITYSKRPVGYTYTCYHETISTVSSQVEGINVVFDTSENH